MQVFRTLLAGAVLVLAVAAPVAATTAVEMSDESLVESADLIVVGTAQEVESTWLDRDLVTLATVEVAETLKGAADGPVTVVLPGGVDADAALPVAVTWPGAPTLAPGEEVLLFLTHYPAYPGGYAVAGFSQGKFAVFEGPGGEAHVTRDLSTLRLVAGQRVGPGSERTVRLDDFRARVRGLLAAREVER